MDEEPNYIYSYRISDLHKGYLRSKLESEKWKEKCRLELIPLEKEMDNLRTVLKVETLKKKTYDIEMVNATDLEVLSMRQQVDDYKNQIAKLQMVLDVSQKALLTMKKAATEEYRKKNPFDAKELKRLQNKEYSLSQKIRILK